jgi:tRNA threonylcarbamoyladenosine biosynthesis protein TsaB
MALILNIDTATEHASVCLSKDAQLVAIEENPNQKDHASFIQPAIKKMLSAVSIQLSAIDAIAVSNGPGSYTGLRVGLSTAKGLCYALNKPLILLNTLEVIAFAAIAEQKLSTIHYQPSTLFCPMIDARRMEVFTALYDENLNNILPPTAMILDENSFADQIQSHQIIFSGSGSIKFQKLMQHSNAIFSHTKHDACHMQTIAEKLYSLKNFADVAYSEPFYLKEFYNTQPKLKCD